jgi:nucleoside-diphosphate-sugar epimerase
MSDLHVIFGAGQVGTPLAAYLLDRGTRVRVARRSAEPVPGAQLLQGDAANLDFCVKAAEDASVVYHCMNPPYDSAAWTSLLPRYMDNLIDACRRAQARLVVLDNLYMYGRTGGAPINEATSVNPCSRKGTVRARVADRLFEAHRRGEVRAVSGRASDFYGPGAAHTHLDERFWKLVLARKRAQVLIDPDAIHTYHYIPDVARGLAALGWATDDVEGLAWMLPCAPAGTLRALVGRFGAALGRPVKIERVPRLIVKGIALFSPLVREVDEMLYQWDAPLIVDDRRFRERFDVVPEPEDTAARATVEWATRAYGAATA